MKHLKHYETWGKEKKEKKRLSVGHVRGYSMHRYRFAFLLVYKSNKTEHFPLTVTHSHKKHSPLLIFFTSVEWRSGGEEEEEERGSIGISTARPPPPHIRTPLPQKTAYWKQCVELLQLKAVIWQRKKKLTDLYIVFSARSWIFLSYKE